MLISFIIPAYRSCATLERCLKSIVRLQSLPPAHEIIVVLCRPTERELAIIARLQKQANIKALRTQTKNRSLSRNLGATEAQGEYLAFVDSDVCLGHDWLRHHMDVFKNKLVAASQGSFRNEDSASPFTRLYGFVPHIGQCARSPFGPVIVTGACIYRAAIFYRLGMFDVNVLWNEDLNLSVTAFNKGFALAYNSRAQAVLLEKPPSLGAHAKRSFIAGKALCRLSRYTFWRAGFAKNARFFGQRMWASVGAALRAEPAQPHLWACAGYGARLLGFLAGCCWGARKNWYSFPRSFHPYLGFKARHDTNKQGLLYINNQRYLLNVDNKKLICVQ